MADKVEAFKKLLKDIFRENADNRTISNTVKQLRDENGTNPLICFGGSKPSRFLNRSVLNFSNWMSGHHRPTLFEDREKLIDFLLYFCGKDYQTLSYSDRRKKFNTQLKCFHFDNLRLLGSWQEFCVFCTLKFTPEGNESLYHLFKSIYENEELRQLLLVDSEYECENDSKQYTNRVREEFDKLTEIDSKEETGAGETLCHFLQKYGPEIGRARLSAFRLYVALVLNEDRLGKNLFDDSWKVDTLDMIPYQLEKSLEERLETGRTLAEEFEERCETSVFQNEYKKRKEKKYQSELNKARESNDKATIFDLDLDMSADAFLESEVSDFASTDIGEFLRLKSKGHISDREYKAIKLCMERKTATCLEDCYKQAWHQEAENFYCYKTTKGTGSIALKDIIATNKQRFFSEFQECGVSVSREVLIWAFILCLKSSTIRKTIPVNHKYMSDPVSKKLEIRINHLLTYCGMLPLESNLSSEDEKLLAAIQGVDYEQIYLNKSNYFPLREFVLQQEKKSERKANLSM